MNFFTTYGGSTIFMPSLWMHHNIHYTKNSWQNHTVWEQINNFRAHFKFGKRHLKNNLQFFFYPVSPLILNYRVNEIVKLKGVIPYKSLFESVSFLCWPFWHAHSIQKTAKLIKESLYWPDTYQIPNRKYANMNANTQIINIYVRLQHGFDPIVSGVHGDTKIHPRRKVSFYWVNGFVKLTLLPTLTCRIIVQQILLIFGKNNTYTTLLGPARLLISDIFPSKADFHLHKWEKILPTWPY